jgi:hypothetical protein
MRRNIVHQILHIKTYITVICIILTYIILTSIVVMSTHVIWNTQVIFCYLIYDAFCPWLCLIVLSTDKLIIHETTPNQVFTDNLTIFKHHNVIAYFTRAIYCLFILM